MSDHIHTRAAPESGRQWNYCPHCRMVPFGDAPPVPPQQLVGASIWATIRRQFNQPETSHAR
jgi:hypothetical protein